MVDIPLFKKREPELVESSLPDSALVDSDGERADAELVIAKRLADETSIGLSNTIIVPERLEGSEAHQMLTKDMTITNVDKNEFFIGAMYFSLLIDFLELDLRLPAREVHAEYQHWLSLHTSVNGFGREQLNTTIIGRKYQKGDGLTQPLMKV